MAKLAQEITSEFLTCKICLDEYKNPKCLNCLHTFCENCIENHVMSESTYKKYSDYREFTCPLCRKRTQLPIGGVKKLLDNFLVSSLAEAICRQRPSKFPFCDICKLVTHKHKDATSKCLDCCKLLCKLCVDLHRETKVTSSHSVFDVEIEKDIECKEHKDEVVRFYCEPCESCICVLCTFNEHKGHEIATFIDSVAKYRANIENLLRNCQEKIEDFGTQIEQIARCSKNIKITEERIHELAIESITQIRQREKLLIEEIHNIYGPELMNLISNKSELEGNLDGLKTACNLTEMVLKGKDIELLLLKKQVQEKLSTLSDLDIPDLPDTIDKEIKYFHGQIDMGFIQDMDRPTVTRYRHTRPSLPCLSDQDLTFVREPTQMENIGTQTSDDEEEEEEPSEEEEPTADPIRDEGVEVGVQCTPPQADVTDRSTVTELLDTEDKGVNTRCRSSLDNTTIVNDCAQSPTTQRRARRRRERAKTADISQEEVSTISGSIYGDSPSIENGPNSNRRSRFHYGNSGSMEDNFYSPEIR